MCGIAGFFNNFSMVAPQQQSAIVLKMMSEMTHRGPDDHGIWLDPLGRCCLGHLRLSIIDISSAGHQPMASANGQLILSFNGEIYNFQELQSDIEALGIRLHSKTDTEVLAGALQLFGTAAFAKLDGMYALAAFEPRGGTLTLARDPFGEKPLY